MTLNSDRTYGGVYVGTYTLGGNTTQTYTFDGTTYPNLSGRVIRAMVLGAGGHSLTVTQGSPPSLTLTRRTTGYPLARTSKVMVFAV
jgi:hypothetical protein